MDALLTLPYIPYNKDFRPFHIFIAIAISRSLGRILEEDEDEGKAFLISLTSKIENNKIGLEELDVLSHLSEFSPEQSLIQNIKASAQSGLTIFRGLSKYWRREERQFWSLFLSELWTLEEEQKLPTIFSLFLNLKGRLSIKTIVGIFSSFVEELLKEKKDIVKLSLEDVSKEFVTFVAESEKVSPQVSLEFLKEIYTEETEISSISILKVYRLDELLIHGFAPHLIVLEEKSMWDAVEGYLNPFGSESKKKGENKKKNDDKKEEMVDVFLGEALSGHQVKIISSLLSKFQFKRHLTRAEWKSLAKTIKKLQRKKEKQGKFFAAHLLEKDSKRYFLRGYRVPQKIYEALKKILESMYEENKDYFSLFYNKAKMQRGTLKMLPPSSTFRENVQNVETV